MKRQFGIATATAAFFAASLVAAAAQTPPPTTTQSPQSRTPSTDSVTVTGCLQPSSSASSATSSTATSSMTPSFVLANATMGSKGTGTTGTTGTTSTTATSPESSAKANATYALLGSDSDLKKHVGHKVEVTGKIDSSSADRPSATTGTATATSHDANAPKIQVSSIRMIAPDCSGK